jgi:hypothetical protein
MDFAHVPAKLALDLIGGGIRFADIRTCAGNGASAPGYVIERSNVSQDAL